MSHHIANIVSRDDIKIFSEDEVRELVSKLEIFGDFDPFNYTPPGPIGEEFLNSTFLTAFIMGPLGGGKTTLCAFRRILAATLAPVAWHPEDGKPTRMCRWIVLRDTFRSAEKTVLESWKQWFPKTFPGCKWAGGNDRPVTHTLRFMGSDGIRIEVITEFAGLGENSIETLMKGREYSGGWLNEADTHSEGALDDLEQRVGRYPSANILLTVKELEDLSKQLGHKVFSGQRQRFVIGDLNAPTVDNWVYKDFVKKVTEDRKLYRQPSGQSEQAENLFNLEVDYYSRIIRNQDEHFVKRMVDNEFGYSRHGKPVYEKFNRTIHVARFRITFEPKLTLGIGIDISMNTLNPAAVFGQVKGTGRISVIDELYLGHGVGAARFAEGLLRKLEADYSSASNVRIWCDPAAEYGADREGGQLAAMETIAMILSLPVLIPAGGSNELGMRMDAVKTELRGYHEPDSEMIICPEKCPFLLEGFDGKYRFKRRKETASTEFEEQPEKTHPWSDVQDGLQYLILGFRGRTGVLRGAADHSRQGNRFSNSKPSAGGSPWSSGSRGGFDPHRVGRR
ncbi:hypothetical protein [Pseudochrobactrum asaccharolyticum]|uniref:Terminase family protein n=1 Tax=Pseudochrobactrum asaccharolyticum TaxID=354351 RepID=A0A366E0B7_9HYPH|nr:hypothetical protein [Pseudochrobactrum asaccharolyticum]RBO94954.1 hypothetical protein DFR47_104316 [Pseudochrobactrum asaccharolyticum]